jgi:GntR family transcriptional regulator/MocR family aminotransferase
VPLYTLDRAAGAALYLQLARAIVDDVRRGRLRPGQPLPGTRTLAAALDVDRKTVLAAYGARVAEGWRAATAARGTAVARELPEAAPPRAAARRPAAPGYRVLPRVAPREPPALPRGAIELASARPDIRLVDVAGLARAQRRALVRRPAAVLSTGDPRGQPALRRALAAMLAATRNLAVSEEEMLVTRGSQMSLYLIARALVRPGDAVAVEELGYPPAAAAFAAAGAEILPIPVDAGGLRVDLLERARPVRAVVCTPHNQYPTTVPLAAERRLRLLSLARRRRFAVVEDDCDHEFHFEGAPLLPLASMDTAGVVIYVGTLSKILAPGLRVGFLCAPPPVIAALAAERAVIDRHGDAALELALAELLDDGEIERHIGRARRVYRARRAALLEALAALPGLAVDPPRGGLAVWARAATDVDAWARRAVERGVWFPTGRSFHARGAAVAGVRLGFAAHDERTLRDAVRRMAAAWPTD